MSVILCLTDHNSHRLHKSFIIFAEDWTGPLNYFRNLPFYRLDEQNLRELDVRCLLITGKSDESILLESLVRSTEYIRTYFLKVIDDAGHYPHQEKPEMVNTALLEFLLGKISG